MKSPVRYSAVLSILICTILTCLRPVYATHIANGGSEYGFGVVPQFEQRKLFRIWRPVLDEMERRTGLAFHLVGSQKIPKFENKYLEGTYDFAYMNPYHILKVNASQVYLSLVRDGERTLSGILVVQKDSPIQDVK